MACTAGNDRRVWPFRAGASDDGAAARDRGQGDDGCVHPGALFRFIQTAYLYV